MSGATRERGEFQSKLRLSRAVVTVALILPNWPEIYPAVRVPLQLAARCEDRGVGGAEPHDIDQELLVR